MPGGCSGIACRGRSSVRILVWGFGVFPPPRFGVQCFRERSRERCLTPGGCGLNEPRLRKLGAALPCLSNTGEEEVMCTGLGSSEGS